MKHLCHNPLVWMVLSLPTHPHVAYLHEWHLPLVHSFLQEVYVFRTSWSEGMHVFKYYDPLAKSAYS
jgi:hypothetical protein